MAQFAVRGEASIQSYTPVLLIRRQGDHWTVEATKDPITAKHIVNAAGTWGWEMGLGNRAGKSGA